MGRFAALCCAGRIEDKKKEEFTEKVEKVFQYGGMMDRERVDLCGKHLRVIRKARMDSDGMNFYYNYFEDACWENAGFDKDTCMVWSNKISDGAFGKAVIAAYVLEEQYSEGSAIALDDGDFVTEWDYVGWLNYLFGEYNHVKNFDTWKLYENCYYWAREHSKWDNWEEWKYFGGKRYGFISSCEIYTVIYGVDKALKKFEMYAHEKTENIAIKGMRMMRRALKELANIKHANGDVLCDEILSLLRCYYENEEDINTVLQEGDFEDLILGLKIADAPAFLVKGIAEIFEKDFWELWKGIKDVVCRKAKELYGNENCYVEPVPTAKFFDQTPDNMILYWENDGKLIFSDELWKWFEDLKRKYNQLVMDDVIIKKPLPYILGLMEEANDDFYNIYTFADFFEETLEHMSDKKYQTLWRLYDNLIHNQELRKAADVIFVPEGPGHEHEGLFYIGEQPKRRLIERWDFMEKSKKENIGRITLKRYMALLSNKILREKVFGF